MGRYNLAPQRVHQTASLLLETKRIPARPPWYDTIGTVPPSERLVRPALQRPQKPGRKASRLFKPLNLKYQEDQLRWEYFNDHPWELARPRVILENDGKDHEKWDWGHALCRPRDGHDEESIRTAEQWERRQQSQASRPLNGEAVVQRQNWLMQNQLLTRAKAYDIARKELYQARHAREIEQRVAKEEAQAMGSYFGLGPLEVGMQLEDQKYEEWRAWAEKEIAALKQLQGAAYTGMENEELDLGSGGEEVQQSQLDEVSESVPTSRGGKEALGGAAVHP